MRKIVLVTVIALSLGTTNAIAATKSEAANAIFDAVNATLGAAKHRGEWRDTYKFISKAKKAYRKGDYNSALKLAMKAKRQGELGKMQAQSQQNATTPKYIYSSLK